MARTVVLLGPQRYGTQVPEVFAGLGHEGEVATISAGWAEREGDDHELRAAVGGHPVPLNLYARWRDVVTHDPEYAAAERQRRDRLDELRTLYVTRLHYAIGAVAALRRQHVDQGFLAEAIDDTLEAIRALDVLHLRRVADVDAAFYERWAPHERPVVALHREDVARQVAEAGAIAIAGGHVGVLVRCLHLFNLGAVIGDLPVVAWSAGAMAVTERVVLFHDLAPHDPGHAEVLGAGLGLVRDAVALPHAPRRLDLADTDRLALLARRFAPQRLVPLDHATRVDTVDGVLGPSPEIRVDGTIAWQPIGPAGRVDALADAVATATDAEVAVPVDGASDSWDEVDASDALPLADPFARLGRDDRGDGGDAARDGTAATDASALERDPGDPAEDGAAGTELVETPSRLAIDELRARVDRGEHVSPADVDAFLTTHASPIVEGDRATFLFRGEAERVLVQHRVVGLPPAIPMRRLGETDLWYVIVNLPPRSRVEYHLEIVRDGHGHHVNDPLNPHQARNPMGSESVARAAGYRVPSWVLHDPEARPGELRDLHHDSAALGRTVHAKLYLPARFRATHRYPLIVVHDGHDYLEFASAQTVLDNLVHRLDVDELVAVFVSSSDRLVEYADHEGHARFVMEELVPRLEDELPLVGQPPGRCLMGASFGGIAAFSTALRYPGEVGSLLLQSTSFAVLDIGDDLGEDLSVFRPVVEMLQRYRAEPVRVADRIYQTVGAYEPMVRGNRAMVPVLQGTGSEVRYVEARDGHNWENWRDRLRDGLSWLFPGPQKYVYE